MLLDHSVRHVHALWDVMGRYLKGAILVRYGNHDGGLRLLQTATTQFREAGFVLYRTASLGELAESWGNTGLTVAQNPPKSCDVDFEIALLNESVWPGTCDQFVLADEIAGALNQKCQEFMRLSAFRFPFASLRVARSLIVTAPVTTAGVF